MPFKASQPPSQVLEQETNSPGSTNWPSVLQENYSLYFPSYLFFSKETVLSKSWRSMFKITKCLLVPVFLREVFQSYK